MSGTETAHSRLLRSVLPELVQLCTWDELAAEGETEESAIADLWPVEAEASATFSPRRRADYAAVRAAARRALRRAEIEPTSITKGSRGMPIFPPRVVGALTHTEGLRAAAIARTTDFRAVGIDAEQHRELPPGVLQTISLPAEQRWLRAVLDAEPWPRMDAVLFSAKEATYKAWFPLTRRWLGFQDVEITLRTDSRARAVRHPGAETGLARRGEKNHAQEILVTGTFSAKILIDPTAIDGGAALTHLHGGWAVSESYVVTAVTVPSMPPNTQTHTQTRGQNKDPQQEATS